MKKQKKKIQNGITLIVLVITIIVLLILAGVSISLVVGENGILRRAQESVKLTKAKEIEEEIGLIYMDKKAEELTGGSKVTIETIVNDLREKGYTIEEKQGGKITVEEIEVNNNELTIEKGQTASISYTLKTSVGEIQYFIEIQGEYHEISYDNKQVIISEEITDINNLGQVDEKITVTSENTGMVVAALDENEKRKINLTAGTTGGLVKVTVNEEKSGKSKEVAVTVREPATNLTLTPTTATVLKGQSIKINATIEPSNSTDKVIWGSSSEQKAQVDGDGTVYCSSSFLGPVTITGTCGNIRRSCNITIGNTVNALTQMKSDLVGNGFSLIDKSTQCDYYDFNQLKAGGHDGEWWWHANFKWEPKDSLDVAIKMDVVFSMWAQTYVGKYNSSASATATVYFKDGTTETAGTGSQTTGELNDAVWKDFKVSLNINKKPVDYVVFNLSGFNCYLTGSGAMIKEITLSN